MCNTRVRPPIGYGLYTQKRLWHGALSPRVKQVWQPERQASGGRRALKRGILAYRAAYPDLVFTVLCASGVVMPAEHGSSRQGCKDAPAGSTEGQGLVGPSSEQEEPRRCVFVHWSAQGTNLGFIRDAPPSGKKVSFSGVPAQGGEVVQKVWAWSAYMHCHWLIQSVNQMLCVQAFWHIMHVRAPGLLLELGAWKAARQAGRLRGRPHMQAAIVPLLLPKAQAGAHDLTAIMHHA